MRNSEFILKLSKLASTPTCYATGAFGASVGMYNNRDRYSSNTSNKAVKQAIKDAPDGTFLFDCIGLGKALLWDFSFDPDMRYGGAVYKAHDIPDFSIKSLDKYGEFSTNMDYILIGEWLRSKNKDHVGYYIGEGMYIDISQSNKDYRVTIHRSINDREWDGHCKMQWIEYADPFAILQCPHCGKDIKIIIGK